jgi:SAM-dependent methyltransferase
VTESPYVRESGYAVRYRDQRFRSGTGGRTDRLERRRLRSLLATAAALTPTGTWLDAPCGAGRLSDELPAPTVLVDRDAAMVAAAPAGRPRACASVHALPFADGTFAGVLCMRLLQHIATPAERIDILRELARVSRGPIVLSFFDARSLQHLRRRLRPLRKKRRSGRHAVSRPAFTAELRAAGLEPVAMHALRRFVAEQTLVLCVPIGDRLQ